jgi:hypothetical protein
MTLVANGWYGGWAEWSEGGGEGYRNCDAEVDGTAGGVSN